MKTKTILFTTLGIMAVMIAAAILFPHQIVTFLIRPALYPHALFVHILSTTLFFANAFIGMIWELRSLSSSKAVILHTYKTVSWLDARFSTLLILVSVISGVTLSAMRGDFWQTGWLSVAFVLFILSGIVWVASDIPTQYKVKKLMAETSPDSQVLPEKLIRVLKLRLIISLAGVLPLIAVFILMVYKPAIMPVAQWFQ